MFSISLRTRRLLEQLEQHIDPQAEEDLQRQWSDFLFDRFEGVIFEPCRRTPMQAIACDAVNINDAIDDLDTMLYAQLSGAAEAFSSHTGTPAIRANYGTGILSSVLGAELFTMPYAANTLPTTRPLGDNDSMRALLWNGVPSLEAGLGARVFAFGEAYAALMADYPCVARYVYMYHPDLQGPLDICELLWGGEMFYAMYDEPELVHEVLALITEVYTAFMRRWQALFPPRADMNPHWSNLWHRGSILLRSDSAMNLSPELYREFSVPYDALLLERFGGGAVHFCGRGDHYIAALSELKGLYGVQMTQPSYNDMEIIYRHTVDKGIKLLAFDRVRAEQDSVRNGAFSHHLSV